LLTIQSILSVSSAEALTINIDLIQKLDGLDESIRQKILEALNKSSSRVASVEEKLRQSELENRYLRELLRRERIAKYGPGSEKLSDERAGAFGS
jgi:hypothetical protein